MDTNCSAFHGKLDGQVTFISQSLCLASTKKKSKQASHILHAKVTCIEIFKLREALPYIQKSNSTQEVNMEKYKVKQSRRSMSTLHFTPLLQPQKCSWACSKLQSSTFIRGHPFAQSKYILRECLSLLHRAPWELLAQKLSACGAWRTQKTRKLFTTDFYTKSSGASESYTS